LGKRRDRYAIHDHCESQQVGFWLWQVKSKQEAIEWVKRCPNPHNEESVIEIHQVFEAKDFGAAFTPELREQEAHARAQAAQKR